MKKYKNSNKSINVQHMFTNPTDKGDPPIILIFGCLLGLFALALSLTYIQNLSANNPTDHSKLQQGIVHRIIDGDTIDVIMSNGEIERVRFIGIDAPERGEAGFQEATNFVAGTIPIGSTVWLEQQGNDRDRFSRLRRVVWFEYNGHLANLNQLMLDMGLVVEMILGE